MSNIKTIAVVHNGKDMKVIDGIVTTEMTHEECIMHITRMRREMDRMRKDYIALLETAKILEAQRNRLLKEKYASLERELESAYPRGLIDRLFRR